MLPKQDYKVQKKDYIPLLSNCDNLIEEYAREMLGSVGQGMKHMIGRYTSLPSLSLKIKEFLNVLLHPRKYTSEIWDVTRVVTRMGDPLVLDESIMSIRR